MHSNKKLIRITTVPISLDVLLRGQLRFMSHHFDVIGVSSAGKELERVKKNEGIRVIELNMKRKPSPFFDLISIFKLYFVLKKEKPFIVHTHTPKAGMVGMISAFIARVPIRMHTVAGLPLVESKGIVLFIYKLIEKLTYKCATQIYPNSYNLSKLILNYNLTNINKVKVIGNGSSNGIDTEHFAIKSINIDKKQFRNSLSFSEKDFVFVFIGRIVADKGVNEMFSAFDAVCASYFNVKLLVVGNYERHLDPISKRSNSILEKNNNIKFVGYQNDIRQYLAISDCLILPSYREGFPNVVLQAGALELCSIVTNINGSNEIVINNETGLVVEAKSINEITQAMEFALSSKTKIQNMGKQARNRIVNNYEQKFIWEQLLMEYNNRIKNV